MSTVTTYKVFGTFSKKYGVPVYANEKTWSAMPNERKKIDVNNQIVIELDNKFNIGDLEIISFPIPHDAACPCGYNIFNSGKKISIATDIGHITPKIMSCLENSCFALLEANYDPDVLKYSSYPYHLKCRIDGPQGHLSNNSCGKVISHLMDSGLNCVMLGHLSKENNFPELAYQTVANEINTTHNADSINIMVANRNCPSDFIYV